MQGFAFPDHVEKFGSDIHISWVFRLMFLDGVYYGTRPEYMLFKPAKFKERIYQEVKRKKYLYYLELKRVQEKKKRGVPIDDPGDVDSDTMQVEE